MIPISERLKLLRMQRGFTQDEIANYLNIHRTTYTKYETKHAPDVDSLVKIARLYGMSLDELVSGTPSKSISSKTVPHAPGFYDDVDLGVLSDDEKRMILLLRSCSNVDKAIYLVKKMILNDEFRDMYFESDSDMKNNP